MIPLLALLSPACPSLLSVLFPQAHATSADDASGKAAYHLAQARQFVKNKWYADAANEIELGLGVAGGANDFELNWLGAQVYYELVRMERAANLAARAAVLSPNDTARERAQAFHDDLVAHWGEVTLRAPYAGMRTRLQVEARTPILDPDQKRLLNKVALQLRAATPLPVTVSLPVGEFLVNGVPVVVQPGGTSTVALQMDQLGARGLAALQVSRLEVSAGAMTLFGDRVANLGLGGTTEVGFTQPLGPVLLGLVAHWDARSYRTVTEVSVFDPLAFGVGLRLGHELVVGGPLAVRPSLGVRFEQFPGVALGCTTTEATSAECAPPSDGSVALTAYADARGFAPYAEIAVEYRQAGRTTALGVGVKAEVEEVFARVPAEGEIASVTDESAPLVRYQAEDTAFMATGVRLLATVDFAF